LPSGTSPAPGPVSERKLGQPQVEYGNGNQGPTERYAVVKHEADDATIGEDTQLARAEPEVGDVMGKELSTCGEKDGEDTRQEEGDGGQLEKRDSIVNERRQQTLIRTRALLDARRGRRPRSAQERDE